MVCIPERSAGRKEVSVRGGAGTEKFHMLRPLVLMTEQRDSEEVRVVGNEVWRTGLQNFYFIVNRELRNFGRWFGDLRNARLL